MVEEHDRTNPTIEINSATSTKAWLNLFCSDKAATRGQNDSIFLHFTAKLLFFWHIAQVLPNARQKDLYFSLQLAIKQTIIGIENDRTFFSVYLLCKGVQTRAMKSCMFTF